MQRPLQHHAKPFCWRTEELLPKCPRHLRLSEARKDRLHSRVRRRHPLTRARCTPRALPRPTRQEAWNPEGHTHGSSMNTFKKLVKGLAGANPVARFLPQCRMTPCPPPFARPPAMTTTPFVPSTAKPTHSTPSTLPTCSATPARAPARAPSSTRCSTRLMEHSLS